MKPEDILHAISDVDENLIERASKKTPNPFWRWSGIAAALVLVIGIAYVVFRQGNLNPPQPPTEVIETDSPVTEEPESGAPATDDVPEFSADDYRLAYLTYGIYHYGGNENAWTAIIKHADEYGIAHYNYYGSETQDTVDCCAVIEQAIEEGANVIFTNGYCYGPALAEVAQLYPDVIFISFGLDDSSQLIDFEKDFPFAENTLNNVLVVEFQPEIAGYLAGYIAVNEGYRVLGCYTPAFVDETLNYANGFAQGAQAAAQENNRVEDVCVRLTGEGKFFTDASDYRLEKMSAWVNLGTQLIATYGDEFFIDTAVYAGAEMVISTGNCPSSNVYGETHVNLQWDMDTTVELLLQQLYSGELTTGCSVIFPYYELVDTVSALTFSEEYETVYQELLSGVRQCTADGTFEPDDFAIEIIWEK